jgi:hypothetical protein
MAIEFEERTDSEQAATSPAPHRETIANPRIGDTLAASARWHPSLPCTARANLIPPRLALSSLRPLRGATDPCRTEWEAWV